MPHSLPLALNTPLNPFISLPTVSLTTYNFIFQYPTHSFLSPSFQPFIPIFHSCTQESHSHHHTRVRTTHLILHNLPCIPICSFLLFPMFAWSSTRAWDPCKHGHLFIPTYLSTPLTHFSNAHETHFSHQYSFSAHSHLFSRAWSPMHNYPSHLAALLLVSHSCKGTLHAWSFSFPSHPQTRKKGQGEWTQTIKGVGAENPHIFLHFLFLEIYFSRKKMATKVPIGVGLSLALLLCASNVRSLVLKYAFFGHGA